MQQQTTKDYMKPLSILPDNFILRVGTNNFASTNDLALSQTSEEIASSIINLATLLKGESRNVSMSSITLRTDEKRTTPCKAMNLILMDNSNRIKLQQSFYTALKREWFAYVV